MDRKTVKRVVMTVPYNAKPFSNRGYIRDALKEKGVEIDKDDLTKTVVAVRNAMDEVVPGPMAVMSWIESEVAKAIDRGEKELTWTTPSGFVVTQKLMKKKTEQVELQLMGRCKLTVAVADDDKVDKQHHKNATAPNLIHSLDASLLHFSALRFDAPIALIHDSVLCRATDMSSLSAIVRETYMHLFAEHDYLRDFAHQIGAETEPPIIGDLKPESVIESTYFFVNATHHPQTEQPVILEGYQAVLKPSKFGYSLSALVDSEMVDALEEDRTESLEWAQGKLKNPKRSVLKPEPWEEVEKTSSKLSLAGMKKTARPSSIPKVHLSQTRIRPCILVAGLSWRSIRSRTSSRMALLMEQVLNWLVYNWCLSIQELV